MLSRNEILQKHNGFVVERLSRNKKIRVLKHVMTAFKECRVCGNTGNTLMLGIYGPSNTFLDEYCVDCYLIDRTTRIKKMAKNQEMLDRRNWQLDLLSKKILGRAEALLNEGLITREEHKKLYDMGHEALKLVKNADA